MKVINQTRYRTSDLRAIFGVALRADEQADGPMPRWQRNQLKVEVVYARRRDTSGYAFLNGTRMRLRVAKVPPMVSSVVWLFLHELAHIRGARHRQMSDTLLHRMANEITASHPELVLRATPEPAPKAKPPLRLARYEHAKEMLAAKEQAIARLERQAAKWRQRVRYYERALRATAPAAAPPADPLPGSTTPETPTDP